MNVVFVGYSWAQNGALDPYQQSIVDSLSQRGYIVHVLLANQYTAKDSLYFIKNSISIPKLTKAIKRISPKFIISMNFGLINRQMREDLPYPVVFWAVDEFGHLFGPDGPCEFDGVLNDQSKIFVGSLELFDQFNQRFPNHKDIYFKPSATNIAKFQKTRFPNKKFNISFVGSFLEVGLLQRLYKYLFDSGRNIDSLLKAQQMLEDDYNQPFEQIVRRCNLEPLLREIGWTNEKLKMVLANRISSEIRINVIEKLFDLGLAIFGRNEWVNPLLLRKKSLAAFQPMSVKSFDDLVSIYQNSKISIHIPQIQVRRALPYRVFDIMASDSMLIFPMEEGSEVFKIFGDQPPFPLYRDADHLRQLCIQYLENEEARQAVVKACQDVMAAGFDFSDRVEFIESICGITESPASGRGVIKKISYVKSLKPTAYVSEVVRSTARAIIDSMLERMPLRLKFYVSLKLESIISQNWF